MSKLNLPDDTHLAYIVWREAWFSQPNESPKLQISASAKGNGGGVAWEFSIEQMELGSHVNAIRLSMFNDSFAAFAQMPEFFAQLAVGSIETLEGVRGLLDDLGAVDETERKGPGVNGEGRTDDAAAVAAAAEVIRRRYPERIRLPFIDGAAESLGRIEADLRR